MILIKIHENFIFSQLRDNRDAPFRRPFFMSVQEHLHAIHLEDANIAKQADLVGVKSEPSRQRMSAAPTQRKTSSCNKAQKEYNGIRM